MLCNVISASTPIPMLFILHALIAATPATASSIPTVSSIGNESPLAASMKISGAGFPCFTLSGSAI